MSYEFKLAWKYFRARRKSLARLTAIVAVTGIAAGVAALIFAQAVTRGFAAEIREKILANTPHITIFRKNGATISDWEKLKIETEKHENIVSVKPTTYESALLVGKKTTAYCVIRTARNPKTETVSIGSELAEKTGLQTGDEAEIILPQENAAPESLHLRVGEIFRTGIYDYDSTWIDLSLEDFAKISGDSAFVPKVLSISLKDVYAAKETSENLRKNFGDDYKILDWQTANEPLFAALGLERKVTFAVISLIIFIAALNITTTLTILVNERKLDIAVLRTCGAQTGGLLKIFLIEGFLLGVSGAIFGLILGLLLCFLANRFALISLPSEIYSISSITVQPQFFDIAIIIFIAFLLSLIATVYPALRALRIKPLENLRRV